MTSKSVPEIMADLEDVALEIDQVLEEIKDIHEDLVGITKRKETMTADEVLARLFAAVRVESDAARERIIKESRPDKERASIEAERDVGQLCAFNFVFNKIRELRNENAKGGPGNARL